MNKLLLLSMFFSLGQIAHAQDVNIAKMDFNSRFMNTEGEVPVDISRFSKPNQFLPGVHELDIYVNEYLVERAKIRVEDDPSASICFTGQQILNWGLDFKKIPDGMNIENMLAEAQGCVDISKVIEGIIVSPRTGDMRINLVIPQAYVSKNPRGYVSPALWKEGSNAGYLNYQSNIYRNTYRGESTTSLYGFLKGGVNIGAWRLRSSGSLSKNNNESLTYKGVDTYLQRSIIPLKAQLTLGNYFSNADVFDSFGFSGIQLATDMNMRPQSESEFAPSIQGVAETNALVSVFQNGYEIYQEQVPPGPFEINDLYASGYSGDLTVVVKEADGRVHQFEVPFSNIVQLIRPGTSKYSISTGRLRSQSSENEPYFLQGTYHYGVSNSMSVYGGVTAAKKYFSASLGAAFNTRIGAIALDVTHSDASGLPQAWLDQRGSGTGQSYRVTMNKNFNQTGTNLVLAAYRYSSKGFLNFTDFAQVTEDVYGGRFQGFSPLRNKFQVYLNQRLSDNTQIYASGISEKYWGNGKGSIKTYQLGYAHRFDWGSMRLNYARTENTYGEAENRTSISASIPLGGNNSSYLSTQATHSDVYGNSINTGVSGSLYDRKVSYSLNADYQDQSGYGSASGYVNYDGSLANIGASVYRSSANNTQIGANLSGSIVVHGGGVNFVSQLGDTFVIVQAEGAEGAKINGSNKDLIGSNGYGVVPFVTPYRLNNVWLDPEGASDVEIVGQGQYIAPTAGAIVNMKFKTAVGKQTILQVKLRDGGFPPSGAEVRNTNGDVVSILGNDGHAFIREQGEKENVFQVVWGKSNLEQCAVESVQDLKRDDMTSAYLEKYAVCH